MKEYIEFNNTDDKRLPMICVSEESDALYICSTYVRRKCMGLPVVTSLKNFKGDKLPLSEKERGRMNPISAVKDIKSNLKYYSKLFKYHKKYELMLSRRLI